VWELPLGQATLLIEGGSARLARPDEPLTYPAAIE
jgi:hypothetical protein